MKNNFSIVYDLVVSSYNCVNVDYWLYKNCDRILLGGWDKRKYVCMWWWGLGKKKVNFCVFDGNLMDDVLNWRKLNKISRYKYVI